MPDTYTLDFRDTRPPNYDRWATPYTTLATYLTYIEALQAEIYLRTIDGQGKFELRILQRKE
jgi:hypothetical protein